MYFGQFLNGWAAPNYWITSCIMLEGRSKLTSLSLSWNGQFAKERFLIATSCGNNVSKHWSKCEAISNDWGLPSDSTTEIPQNGDEKNPVTLGKTGTVEVVDQTDQHGTTEEKGLNVTSEEASTTDPTESEDAAKEYLTGWPFAGLTIALMASIFTAGLDMNVLCECGLCESRIN